MKKIEITFKGKTETYTYENNLDHDEAIRFCKKNKGTLPTRWFLWEYDHDQGKSRWELIGKKLKKVEDYPWAWVSDNRIPQPYRWLVNLTTGGTDYKFRNEADYHTYALCSPALTL